MNFEKESDFLRKLRIKDSDNSRMLRTKVIQNKKKIYKRKKNINNIEKDFLN